MFNAFSLRFVPFSAGTPEGKLSWRRRSERKPDLQPPLFSSDAGKLSLPTGRQATNRAPRPRWWLISVPGNESCHRELISPPLADSRGISPRISRRQIEGVKNPTGWQNYDARCFHSNLVNVSSRIWLNFNQCARVFLYTWLRINSNFVTEFVRGIISIQRKFFDWNWKEN